MVSGGERIRRRPPPGSRRSGGCGRLLDGEGVGRGGESTSDATLCCGQCALAAALQDQAAAAAATGCCSATCSCCGSWGWSSGERGWPPSVPLAVWTLGVCRPSSLSHGIAVIVAYTHRDCRAPPRYSRLPSVAEATEAVCAAGAGGADESVALRAEALAVGRAAAPVKEVAAISGGERPPALPPADGTRPRLAIDADCVAGSNGQVEWSNRSMLCVRRTQCA